MYTLMLLATLATPHYDGAAPKQATAPAPVTATASCTGKAACTGHVHKLHLHRAGCTGSHVAATAACVGTTKTVTKTVTRTHSYQSCAGSTVVAPKEKKLDVSPPPPKVPAPAVPKKPAA